MLIITLFICTKITREMQCDVLKRTTVVEMSVGDLCIDRLCILSHVTTVIIHEQQQHDLELIVDWKWAGHKAYKKHRDNFNLRFVERNEKKHFYKINKK